MIATPHPMTSARDSLGCTCGDHKAFGREEVEGSTLHLWGPRQSRWPDWILSCEGGGLQGTVKCALRARDVSDAGSAMRPWPAVFHNGLMRNA
ncbi:hypothetical protein NDU88_004250 [Pleurodeles waltl]|uniref:Uncharacterized protein n=1 Tax=Pleurodeles waltl TaxID=8319 RepID=A0AAV7VJA2_PLEWA|nr:hypothetical protein NDU88_004250 [Pleurodeles waltl]